MSQFTQSRSCISSFVHTELLDIELWKQLYPVPALTTVVSNFGLESLRLIGIFYLLFTNYILKYVSICLVVIALSNRLFFVAYFIAYKLFDLMPRLLLHFKLFCQQSEYS